MTIGQFKTHFSEVLEQVKGGIGFAVTYGRKREIVGYFLPGSYLTKPRRQLGLLEGRVTVEFKSDYKMSEEDLLG